LNKETDWLLQKLNQGFESFDVYFLDDGQDLYFPYDLVGREQLKQPCSGSYIPIFAGIPSSARVQRMLKPYKKQSQIRPVPSCHPKGSGFEPKNYWRGPVWVNMNWLIWKGLLNYHLPDEAELVKNQTLEMVKKYGIYEYFNPFTDNQSGTGYGGFDFSWTAALVLDMIKKATT
jgi:neutral trehalase